MPEVFEIKARIDGLKSIHNITYAMQIVTISRLKRLGMQLQKAKDSLKEVQKILAYLVSENQKLYDRIFKPVIDPKKEPIYILFFSNRGFCGSFNQDILNHAMQKGAKQILCLGKKAKENTRKLPEKSTQYFAPEKDTYLPQDASQLEEIVRKLRGDQEIYFVYFKFKSIVSQHVVVERFYPPSEDEVFGKEGPKLGVPHFLEPDQATVEKNVIDYYYFLKLMQALRDSSSSEFSQRFMLMKSAVDNVKELSEELTLELNKERQRGITQELAEIIGTFKALQKEK